MIADVQVLAVESKRGLAPQVPLKVHQKISHQIFAAPPVYAASDVQFWPPVTPTVHTVEVRLWQMTATKSPTSIEAGGVIVSVAVALVAEAPSAGTAAEPKYVGAAIR
jgi:hypothetical protein